MRLDRELLKYAFISVGMVVGWFGLTLLSHNILVQILLGWIGLGAIVFYSIWLYRNKLQPPK